MLYFLDDAFWKSPILFVLFIISLAAVIFGRYVIVSVVYKTFLEYVWGTTRNAFRENAVQIKREIKWALLSSLVFTFFCAASLLAYQYDVTAIYNDIDAYSLLYFFLSPALVLCLYETYYYWLHRWMHRPHIFKIVHKVHHESINPTVFTAFSFHPLEATLQFLFFAISIVIIPLHPIMLGVVFMVLTLCAMINHSGVEIYGTGFLIKNVIGSSHHDLHHQEFKTNFGLNFTWWDRVMKTESKKGA